MAAAFHSRMWVMPPIFSSAPKGPVPVRVAIFLYFITRRALAKRGVLAAAVTVSRRGYRLATTWYPFSWLVDLNHGVVNVLGKGDRSILRAAGRQTANANLATIFRAFDRDDPHKFFRFSALLHTQFQDFGSATYEQTGETQGRMHHRHYRCFSPYHCESSAGYYEQCALMHGVSGLTVEEVACQCMDDRTCTFDIRWD